MKSSKNFSKFSYLMDQRLKDVLYLGPPAKIKGVKGGLLFQIFEYIENPTDFALVDGKWSIFSTFSLTVLFLNCLMKHFMVFGCC